MSENKKPTKKQQDVLNAMKSFQHKRWVGLKEIWIAANGNEVVPDKFLPLRRICLLLKDRGLVETREGVKGADLNYRLTSACREVLRG